MKILLDQNISFRVINLVLSHFNTISHVNLIGWNNYSDHEIFKSAKSENFEAIITNENDFENIISEFNPPPKIIHLRLGNLTNQNIANHLISNANKIQEFLLNPGLDYMTIIK